MAALTVFIVLCECGARLSIPSSLTVFRCARCQLTWQYSCALHDYVHRATSPQPFRATLPVAVN